MHEVIGYILYMDFMNHFTGWFIILFSIILLIWHHILVKKDMGTNAWRIWSVLCFAPLIVCAVHFYLNCYKGNESYSVRLYCPIYAGALTLIVLCILRKKKVLYKIAAVLTILASFAGFGYATFKQLADYHQPHIANFSRCGYVESFDKILADMKKNYVLNDWKEIDYDKIRADLMPKVEEAEKNHDLKAYYKVLYEYMSYFHDHHIWLDGFSSEGTRIAKETEEEMAGNDYGFSLITVDSGETIAVMVEEGSAAEKAGIRLGTVITKWNGVDISKAIEEAKYTLGTDEPVKANFDKVKAMYFAGLSEGTVEVTFIDPVSGEKTVSLESIGNYSKRLYAALGRFNHQGLIATFDIEEFKKLPDDEKLAVYKQLKEEGENYLSKMITDDCGYIVFNSEFYDTVKDVLADVKGEYPEIKELVNSKLQEMKSQGMKRLIIDARNNGGGYPIILCELVSLFTDHEILMDMEGNDCRKVRVDGRWKDLDVIVLTNMNCGSSGDGLIYAFLQCPNVTVMGMTNSDGIFQSVGGSCVTSDSAFMVSYPVFPSNDSNGVPMIDTKPDRISRVPLDVMIPVTKKACETIFDVNSDKDYEIEYALAYFDRERK